VPDLGKLNIKRTAKNYIGHTKHERKAAEKNHKNIIQKENRQID